MDAETKDDLLYAVRRKVSAYIESSGLPLNRTAGHEAEVVCPHCGQTAVVSRIRLEEHFEFWKCQSCNTQGDAIRYAMYHLRTDDEETALLDVCRKLGVSVPSLTTITAKELMNKEFPPLVELIEGMLAPGLYILAGAPKIGKSWLVLQIAHHISTGAPLWNRKVMQHEVLYLSLEDTLQRIQRRLRTICDGKTGHVTFATEADMLGDGFEKQLTSYLDSNSGTKVVIIDTLAKVRGVVSSSNVYSSDYAAMSIFKHLADQYKIALILVHHTRKLDAEDTMQKISGTNGLMGCADGAMILEKPNRAKPEATLTMTSRDFEDARILLHQNSDTMCWEFAGFEDELPDDPADPVLAAVAELIHTHGPWKGAAKTLVEVLREQNPKLQVWPNTISRKLKSNAKVLEETFGICLVQSRTQQGKFIELEPVNDMADMSDD